jgi:predicted DNA-binding protein (MmcQ/YjbR family)
MRIATIRTFALALPQTTVIPQWGCRVFKVAGKVFIILSFDGDLAGGISLKCTPEEFDSLVERDGFIQAPYCAKRHWFRLEDPTLVSAPELEAFIRRSYDLVVAGLPKKVQTGLGLVAPAPSPETPASSRDASFGLALKSDPDRKDPCRHPGPRERSTPSVIATAASGRAAAGSAKP